MGDATFSLEEAQRSLAVLSNNEAWRLLGRSLRVVEDDSRMLSAAIASDYLWNLVGTAANRQRGAWLLARVHAELGDAAGAMRHAEACAALTETHANDMAPFDFAYACEALARAFRLAGDTDAADRHLAEAERLGNEILDEEDRDIFFADLRA